MLAWIRTGIALMAFGFAIARFGVFLRQVASVSHLAVSPPNAIGSAWVGAVLVALGMVANLRRRSERRRGLRVRRHGDAGRPRDDRRARARPWRAGTRVGRYGSVAIPS